MIVELTTFLYDKKLDDLGVKSADIPVKFTVDTCSIESVRERVEDEETDICKKTCIIRLKSGDSYQVGTSYDEMLEETIK